MKYDWEYDLLKLKKEDWIALLKDPSIFGDLDLEIVLHVFDCPGHRACASQISRVYAVHVNKISAANRTLAKRILGHYAKEPQRKNGNNKRFWNIVYTGDPERPYDADKYFYWVLRPELAAAIQELYGDIGRRKRGDPSPKKYLEGQRRQLTLSVYERNTSARNACIDHYGAKCTVCGFDFEAYYGEPGKNKIVVHHLTALHEGDGQKRVVSPIHDLRPVCSNCHLIIHSKLPAYTVEEVQEMIKSQMPEPGDTGR